MYSVSFDSSCKLSSMITNKNSTIIAPAYTRTCIIAINCERSIRYITETQKKFTIRYNALVMGFRLVIIKIAAKTEITAKTNISMFSKVHCIIVNHFIYCEILSVPGAGIEPGLTVPVTGELPRSRFCGTRQILNLLIRNLKFRNFICARSRNRTGTEELPRQDFKSCASTNSAIRAYGLCLKIHK